MFCTFLDLELISEEKLVGDQRLKTHIGCKSFRICPGEKIYWKVCL